MQLIINFGNAPGEGKPLWSVPLALYGYFTIWTNTLVALVTTHAARSGDRDALVCHQLEQHWWSSGRLPQHSRRFFVGVRASL